MFEAPYSTSISIFLSEEAEEVLHRIVDRIVTLYLFSLFSEGENMLQLTC